MHVQEKGNRLIVQSRLRSLLFMLLFGLIFALVGLAALWFFGRNAEVVCTRLEVRDVRCEIKEALLGLVFRNKTAINPQEAQIQVNEDSDGDTYRVALVTPQGIVPLTDVWSSGGSFSRTEAQLNQFLKNPAAKTVNVSQQPVPSAQPPSTLNNQPHTSFDGPAQIQHYFLRSVER